MRRGRAIDQRDARLVVDDIGSKTLVGGGVRKPSLVMIANERRRGPLPW